MDFKKKPLKLRVYATPRMSVNMLGEYVNASASRRNAIIKDSRIVPTYIAKRYNYASDIISKYISSGKSDINLLRKEIVLLKTGTYSSKYEKEMAMFSVEAVSAFLNHADVITNIFESSKLEASIHFNFHKINLEGVEISIRPEIILKSSKTKEIIGFIKLYFSKNNELDLDRGDFITCLGRNYFNEGHSLNLAEKNCFVLDVFRGELMTAPRAFKRRMSDISASCREISDRWDRF